MDRHDVERFKSLENSINILREANQSDTLRKDVKLKNLSRIDEYEDEIVNRLLHEKGEIEYLTVKGHRETVLN